MALTQTSTLADFQTELDNAGVTLSKVNETPAGYCVQVQRATLETRTAVHADVSEAYNAAIALLSA